MGNNQKGSESNNPSTDAKPIAEGKCWIYVLKCRANKYYVGRTNKEPEARFEEHKSGNGSEWTSLYPPLEIVEKIEGDTFDEDKYTLKYMETYGIANVRGGSFVQLQINEVEVQKKLDNAGNRCFKCHKAGHFVKNCPGAEAIKHTLVSDKEVKLCSRCGRNTHEAKTCHARTTLSGEEIKTELPKTPVIPGRKKERKEENQPHSLYLARGHKKWTTEEEEKLILLVNQGKSRKDIATEMGRTGKAIKMRCQKLNLKLED